MKCAWIYKNVTVFPVTRMCRVLEVSRSGFYAWRTRRPSARQVRYALLADAVGKSHEDSKRAYGYRKVHEDVVEALEEPCCKETVRLIMKDKGLRAKRSRKFTHTTDSNHSYVVADNLLNRAFDAKRPTRNG